MLKNNILSLSNSRMDLYCKAYIYDVHVRLGILLLFQLDLNIFLGDLFNLKNQIDRCTLKMVTDIKLIEKSHQQCFQPNLILKDLLKNTIKLYLENKNVQLLQNILNIMNYCHWKLIGMVERGVDSSFLNHLAKNLFDYLLKGVIGVQTETEIEVSKDWLQITSKMMQLSTNYHCLSISHEIQVKVDEIYVIVFVHTLLIGSVAGTAAC